MIETNNEKHLHSGAFVAVIPIVYSTLIIKIQKFKVVFILL